ncbi:hypothetical protein D9758_015509 [Tetrapyrgos nigripes]|uniref:Glycoside hydrolase family 76 protein n=1 Tax=Tetrapyrgos nigripes TaxID=182062 RepID=A0A8H5CZF4_9AGAR|nr:hypothetical protein D9758_015509 [Tetrapyrgos nigripes]
MLSLRLWAQLLVLTHCFATVRAQNFTVPSNWQRQTRTLSQDEYKSFAQRAAGQLVPLIDEQTGQIDSLKFTFYDINLAAVLALQDYRTGNSSFEPVLEKMFDNYPSAHNNSFLVATPQWGLSAFYAYRAYNNSDFLSLATSAWSRVSQYLVREQDAKAGTQDMRNVTFPSTCPNESGDGTNQTVAGAVFMYINEKNDTRVNAQTIGPFAALSAYLYEETQNSTYLTAANLSIAFLQKRHYNHTIVLDTSELVECIIDPLTAFTYNTGYAIEAAAVLDSVTSRSDPSSPLPWLRTLVANAINFNGWTGPDGVIFEENADPEDWTSGLKAILIRGLLEARDRNRGTEMATFIENFIDVQVQAVLSGAQGGSDAYTTNWKGKANSVLSVPGNIVALDVLNAAVVVPFNTTSDITHVSHTGVIVGGVVGGLAGVLSVVAVVFFLCRRKRRMSLSTSHESQLVVEPFTRQPSTSLPVSSTRAGIYASRPLDAKLGRYVSDVPFSTSTSALPLSSTNSQSAALVSVDQESSAAARSEAESHDLDRTDLANIVHRLQGILLQSERNRPVDNESIPSTEPPPEYHAEQE